MLSDLKTLDATWVDALQFAVTFRGNRDTSVNLMDSGIFSSILSYIPGLVVKLTHWEYPDPSQERTKHEP